MNLEEMLDALYEKAARDPDLFHALMKTKESRTPVKDLCEAAQKAGVPIAEMDLIFAGEEAYAAMRRSTNGGGENSPLLAGSDDYYELFLARLSQARPYSGWIGVMDSGVGGISVLREMTELLPGEHFLYFGDSANAPYGSKTEEFILKRTEEIVSRMVSLGVKAAVIACNTATSVAAAAVRAAYPDLPIIGVEPALNVAVSRHEGKAFLVMATEVTLALEKYHALEGRLRESAEFYPLACKGLAKRIEEGRLKDPDLADLLEELLGEYRGKVDGVVLGCTHYPLIKDEIRKVLGDLPLYDGGEGTARQLARRLAEEDLLTCRKSGGRVIFRSSGDTPETIKRYEEFYDLAGRVRKEEHSLSAALSRLAESGAYPFHMPGHKRNAEVFEAYVPGQTGRSLAEASKIDITEICGFDDLHDPHGVLKDLEAHAAAVYGAKETILSVNGSTAALMAAVSAAVPFGERVLLSRNAHRSIYHAAALRRMQVSYLMPEMSGPYAAFVSGGPVTEEETARAFEKAVREGQKIRAVVITSPTYEGIVTEVRRIAETAHAHGAVLIVDEAHGAHFTGHSYFPVSAVKCGADLVVQSLHKTMPALTQTAIIHNVTGRVPEEKLRYYMDLYETSSPSYLLMASAEAALAAAEDRPLMDAYADRLKEVREALSGLSRLTLLETVLPKTGCAGEKEGGTVLYDPSKIVIGCGSSSLSGAELAGILRKKYRLEVEMQTPRSVLFMTSPADTEEGFARLKEALFAIDRECEGSAGTERIRPLFSFTLPEAVMTPGEACDAAYETAELREAEGRISAQFADAYPPDLPLIVPGERIPEGFAEEVRALAAQGIRVRHLEDGVRVVRECI